MSTTPSRTPSRPCARGWGSSARRKSIPRPTSSARFGSAFAPGCSSSRNERGRPKWEGEPCGAPLFTGPGCHEQTNHYRRRDSEVSPQEVRSRAGRVAAGTPGRRRGRAVERSAVFLRVVRGGLPVHRANTRGRELSGRHERHGRRRGREPAQAHLAQVERTGGAQTVGGGHAMSEILLQVLPLIIGAVVGAVLGTRDERVLFDARARRPIV